MTAWKPIDTAPRDGSVFLARLEYEEDPVVVYWSEIREKFIVSSNGLEVEAGWDGGYIVQDRHNVFTEWAPIPD